MIKRMTLQKKLLALLGFTIFCCIYLSYLMFGLHRQTAEARVALAEQRVALACQDIMAHYLVADAQTNITRMIFDTLQPYPAVEGGLWNPERGFYAYAFPTYVGSGFKQDLPGSEIGRISQLNDAAWRAGEVYSDKQVGQRETLLFQSCPSSAITDAIGWTMTRVPTDFAQLDRQLFLATSVLFAMMLLSGMVLWFTLRRWTTQFQRLKNELKDDFTGNALAEMGEPEIDELIVTINTAWQRLSELNQQLGQHERLAGLGRMSANLAHEIRNPLGTIRLRAENALADPQSDKAEALERVLAQTEKLERLLELLMDFAKPTQLTMQVLAVDQWLAEEVGALTEQAKSHGVLLQVETTPLQACFDPIQLGRALRNIVRNALQHTAAGGEVRVSAAVVNGYCQIDIDDTGRGVPEALRANIFEPFVTGRHDGIGLGLALSRELVHAHAGKLSYQPLLPGSRFRIQIPC